MRPSKVDVEQMTLHLMSISMNVQRVSSGRSEANTLIMLQNIAAGERLRPSDLAAIIGVHQSSIARQLRALEDSGYVELVADPADRRSCFVTLTDSGVEECRRLTDIGLDRFVEFVKDWDTAEVNALAGLLSKLDISMSEAKRERLPAGGRRWQHRP